VDKRFVALAAAAVLLLTAGVVVWRVAVHRSPYQEAIGSLPASTLRATYTDWSGVRSLAGGTAVGSASSPRQVDRFLTRAYDKDLTSASAVSDTTYAMQRKYGVSPLNAEWEAYGQSRKGAVDVLKMGDSVDMDGIEGRLRGLGYRAPVDGPGTGGVWAGSSDLVARIGALSSVQQNVVVLADQRLVLMSDSAVYASEAADVIQGDAASLDSTDGVTDLASAGEDPVSARMWASDFACEDLSMGNADQEDQRVADGLVARAGEISPLSGLVMSQQRDGNLVVGMHFEDDDQASENLQSRTNLAAGPAPGQGGSFRARFAITSSEARGSDVVLDLRPRGDDALLSDLSQGPVLFATC
jgi:hypothetical protein